MTKIRILCLHNENSSAASLIDQLQLLGQRLQHNHNIELAFVNAPHIIARPAPPPPKSSWNDDKDQKDHDEDSEHPDNDDNNDDDDEKRRVWYYNSKEKIGLDASILHLRQIWTRSLYSNPFSGILGIGQGAAIGGLLPALSSFENIMAVQDYEDDDEDNDCEDDANDANDANDDRICPMFENLKFCIFINGWDLLLDTNNNNSVYQKDQDKIEDDSEDEALRINHIPTLHIIPSLDNHDGMKLFERYGGAEHTSNSLAEKYVVDNCHDLNRKTINVLGKFIVAQKKKIMSPSQIQAINHSPIPAVQDPIHESHDKTLLLLKDMENTRLELARVEQEALELIQQTISENPPKALMAMIMPDSQRGGSLVGGWDGDRDAFRSKEFVQSGGAPCPKEFTLPFKVRFERSKRGFGMSDDDTS